MLVVVLLLEPRNDEKRLVSFCLSGAVENDKIDLLAFWGVTQFELEFGMSGISRFSKKTPVCSNTVLSQFTMNLFRNVVGRRAAGVVILVSSAMATFAISSSNGIVTNESFDLDMAPTGVCGPSSFNGDCF